MAVSYWLRGFGNNSPILKYSKYGEMVTNRLLTDN